MAKQIILILLLSLAAIMFRDKLGYVLDGIVYAHNKIASALHVIFSDDHTGRLIQDMIALLFIPALCGLVVSAGFWLVKRSQMPHVMVVVWVVWLILLVTMAVQRGRGSPPAQVVSVLVPVGHHSS